MRTERVRGAPRANDGRGRGRAARGLGLGLAAGVFLMLLAPATLGALVPATTIKAPFTTATVTLANPKTMSGCGSAKLVTKAFFNKTTGIGGFSSRDNSTWCTSSTNNSALQEGKITLSIPIPVTTTGIHNITVIWETIATGGVNVTPGRCVGSATIASGTCVRFAQAFVLGTNFIQDGTTHVKTVSTSPLWPGNFTAVWSNTTCSFTSCSTSASSARTSALHTGNAFWSWTWKSISLNASHSYTLHMTLFGGTIVTLMETGGATLTSAKANAQFNSGTLGNDEKLVSITVA